MAWDKKAEEGRSWKLKNRLKVQQQTFCSKNWLALDKCLLWGEKWNLLRPAQDINFEGLVKKRQQRFPHTHPHPHTHTHTRTHRDGHILWACPKFPLTQKLCLSLALPIQPLIKRPEWAHAGHGALGSIQALLHCFSPLSNSDVEINRTLNGALARPLKEERKILASHL